MNWKNVIITLAGVLAVVLTPMPSAAQRVIQVPSVYNANGMTATDILTTTSSAASTNIVTAPAMLYGITADAALTTSNTLLWVNVFNATSANVTAGTTTPKFSIMLNGATNPASTPMPWGEGTGIPFSTAISANCTTTRSGATATASPCHVTFLTSR